MTVRCSLFGRFLFVFLNLLFTFCFFVFVVHCFLLFFVRTIERWKYCTGKIEKKEEEKEEHERKVNKKEN